MISVDFAIRFQYCGREVRSKELYTAKALMLLPERGRPVRIGRKAEKVFVRETRNLSANSTK